MKEQSFWKIMRCSRWTPSPHVGSEARRAQALTGCIGRMRWAPLPSANCRGRHWGQRRKAFTVFTSQTPGLAMALLCRVPTYHLPVTQRIKPTQHGLVFKAPIVWLPFCQTTPYQKLYGMLTPSALLTPSIPPPHKISHPQGGLPRPQKEPSISASSCRRYSGWRGTQKMASPGMWCLPSSMRRGQDSECADCPCRLRPGRAGHLLCVAGGCASQAGISPAVPQFPWSKCRDTAADAWTMDGTMEGCPACPSQVNCWLLWVVPHLQSTPPCSSFSGLDFQPPVLWDRVFDGS